MGNFFNWARFDSLSLGEKDIALNANWAELHRPSPQPLPPGGGSQTAGRVATWLVLLLVPWSSAHELTENRATMVLRDQNHVAITLFLNYSDVLHRSLAPEQSFAEFVLAFSALPPEQFAARLQTAQTRLQSQIKVLPRPASKASMQRWAWPVAARAQELLRDRAMQMLAAPNDHVHESPLEVRVELQTAGRLTAVSAVFPPEFRRVLVVSYRPQQAWVEPGEAAAHIKFE